MLYNKKKQPIIVLGMHRSGTSLISEILNDIGVFMGNDLNVHNESKSILRINEAILSFSHTFWDYPLNIKSLYKDQSGYDNTLSFIKENIEGRKFRRNFFGKQKKEFNNNNLIWGWKEPRTTITFPLWYKLFPNAKFIFLHRNGIDVAQSLYFREKQRQGKFHDGIHSVRCLDFREAFKLWEEYNGFYEGNKNIINGKNLISFSYEEFIENPVKQISNLAEFVEIHIDKKITDKIIHKLKASNTFKFKKDENLKKYYLDNKNHYLMRKYRYDKIL